MSDARAAGRRFFAMTVLALFAFAISAATLTSIGAALNSGKEPIHGP